MIDRRDERVEIAGNVARAEERAIFAEAARRHIPTDALVVEIAQADAAELPPEIALAAFPSLARLAEGRAEVREDTITLTDRALYAQLLALVGTRLDGARFRRLDGIRRHRRAGARRREWRGGLQEEIAAKVAFAVAAATIAQEAEPLLDYLAGIPRPMPAGAVEIAGHPNSDGSAAANRRLSQ